MFEAGRGGGRTGELPNMRRKSRLQEPPAPVIPFWLLQHSSGFGNTRFLFLLLEKKKKKSAFFNVLVRRNCHSPACATCACTVRRQRENVHLTKILVQE